MRLVIDLSACQSASRKRGLGRYAGCVTSAMLAHDGRHDVWLAANAAFPRAFEDLRLRFGHRVPPGRLFRFHHLQRREDMGDLQFEDCAQAAAFAASR
jgi:hypothetical protein